MAIHAYRHTVLDIILIGISRHSNNRNIRPVRMLAVADFFCRSIAIHNRHPNIHQYKLIGSWLGGLKLIHRLLTIRDNIQASPLGAKQHLSNLLIQGIVLCQQNTQVPKWQWFPPEL